MIQSEIEKEMEQLLVKELAQLLTEVHEAVEKKKLLMQPEELSPRKHRY
ncbi:hypothetical protein [Nitrosarchaeum sp.]|nr:hypothetical protein [Nitrosarchaeum sp.]MCV0412668.1 hypothetical protein [Nitrosarchaeum sp.]